MVDGRKWRLELHGRTLGLVGLGAIGQRFARMCHAMGMNVIGFDPYAKNLPDYVVLGTPTGDCCGGEWTHGAAYLGAELFADPELAALQAELSALLPAG